MPSSDKHTSRHTHRQEVHTQENHLGTMIGASGTASAPSKGSISTSTDEWDEEQPESQKTQAQRCSGNPVSHGHRNSSISRTDGESQQDQKAHRNKGQGTVCALVDTATLCELMLAIK